MTTKTVPLEPTEAMIEAGGEYIDEMRPANTVAQVYRAMLAASPPSGGEVYQLLSDDGTWTDTAKEVYDIPSEAKRRILYTSPRVVDEALKVAQQALMEVAHAQEVGPQWYSRGESGLRNQVDMWVRKGLTALQAALEQT